jgi:pimeloyl-[acyl-carrier protein] methyl ester esterase
LRERPISRALAFVLVHGWGFHAGIWRELVRHLPGAEISFIDLGFIRGGPKGIDAWPENAIAVGHSLGALWLLTTAGEQAPFRGFVSIQGFDRFCPYIPPAKVMTMRRSLKRDPEATLRTFWRACGTEPFAPAVALNVDRLDEGLGWLLGWDASPSKASLACPTLALASQDDAIVPRSMSEAIWGPTTLHWSQKGGHVLPLKAPEWCAHHVLDFARQLEP